jgi:hypothetical protein
MDSIREALLAQVPDVPRTVDLRALLQNPSSEVFSDSGGALVLERAIGLGVIHGFPAMGLVNPALEHISELLSPEPFRDIHPGWVWARGVVMTLRDEAALQLWQKQAQGVVVPFDASMLEQTPESLRDLLHLSLERGKATCALVEGQPVAFACVPLGTENRYDLSVDTLEAHRCRGYARMAAAVLIGMEREDGREPMWGALESNPASIRAGMALGFRPVDHLWMARRT